MNADGRTVPTEGSRAPRAEAVEAIAVSEARLFSLLANNSTDVVLLIDFSWKLMWVSPAVENVLGYRPETLIGTNTAELIHPDDIPTLAKIRTASTETLRLGLKYEVRVLGANGEFRWMSGISREALDSQGRVVGRVSTLRDIHAEVTLREELTKSERRYRMLAENSSDVVAEVDSRNVIVWTSPSVDEVLGWRVDQIVGTTVMELTHPDDRALAVAWRMDIAAGVARGALETRVLTGTGSYRWVAIHTKALVGPDGSPAGRVVWLQDIHERVLAHQALANSQQRYRMLAENATDIVWQLDKDSTLVWVTPSVQFKLGWQPEDVLGKSALDLVHPRDVTGLLEWWGQVAEESASDPFELRIQKVDGDYIWMSLQVRPTAAPDGTLTGAVVGLRDVGEQRAARERLARSERTLRLAMDGAPQGMALVGLDGRFIRVNQSLCAMVGRDPSWLLGHTVFELLHSSSLELDRQVRKRLLAGEAEYDVHEARLLTASVEPLWVQHSVGVIRDEQGAPALYLSQYQDITDARALRRDLTYRVAHDSLTGLVNRNQLVELIRGALKRQVRASGVPAVLFCDLDNFKAVNDKFGHGAGDKLLVATARRIQSAVRDSDIVARIGGDEFAVVLPDAGGVTEAVAVAEKIRAAVAEPQVIGHEQVCVTMSIGIHLSSGTVEVQALLGQADEAMYAAKRAGRDCVVVFGEPRRCDVVQRPLPSGEETNIVEQGKV